VTDANVDALAVKFADYINNWSKSYRSEHIAFLFGNDFNYGNAPYMVRQM
jgi:hypothetical protein